MQYVQEIVKEGNSVTYYRVVGEAWGHYAKWNKPVTKKRQIPLTWVATVVEGRDRKWNGGCQGLRERQEGKLSV